MGQTYDLTADTKNGKNRMIHDGMERQWKSFSNNKKTISNFYGSDQRMQECSSVHTELTEVWL